MLRSILFDRKLYTYTLKMNHWYKITTFELKIDTIVWYRCGQFPLDISEFKTRSSISRALLDIDMTPIISRWQLHFCIAGFIINRFLKRKTGFNFFEHHLSLGIKFHASVDTKYLMAFNKWNIGTGFSFSKRCKKIHMTVTVHNLHYSVTTFFV